MERKLSVNHKDRENGNTLQHVHDLVKYSAAKCRVCMRVGGWGWCVSVSASASVSVSVCLRDGYVPVESSPGDRKG